jgi:hypothetical protein
MSATGMREAARFFPGASDREVARRLHSALVIYRGGRWHRDRSEATCPAQHRGKLTQTLCFDIGQTISDAFGRWME